MNFHPQATAPASLRRLILDSLLRWKWGVALVAVFALGLAMTLLLFPQAERGLPAVFLVYVFHLSGLVLFDHDRATGWMRHLTDSPAADPPPADVNVALRSTVSGSPLAGLRTAGAAAVLCVGKWNSAVLPSYCTSVLLGGSASAAAMLYPGIPALWNFRQAPLWVLLLLPVPGVRALHGPLVNLLCTVPFMFAAITGWWRLTSFQPVFRGRSKSTKPAVERFDESKPLLLTHSSQPVSRWMLRRAGFAVAGAFAMVSLYLFIKVSRGEPLTAISSDSGIFVAAFFIIVAIIVAFNTGSTIRHWRSLPLSSLALTGLFILAPVMTGVAFVLGMVAPFWALNGFKAAASPEQLVIPLSILLLSFLIPPMVLTGQRNDAVRLLLLTVLTCAMMDFAGSQNYGSRSFQIIMIMIAVAVVCIWLVLWARGGLPVILSCVAAMLFIFMMEAYPALSLAGLALLAAASVGWTHWLLDRSMLYQRVLSKG